MHELCGLIARERRKRERQRVRLATSPGGAACEELRAGRADDEQRYARRPVDEMVDEVEEAFVGPVEVLEDEDERALVGDPLEQAAPCGKRLVLALTPPGDVLDPRQRAEMAEGPFDVVARQSRRDDRPELSLGLVLRVRLEDAGVRLHHLAQRPETDPLAVRQRSALAPVDELGVVLDGLEQLVDEAALADPRLTDERHQLDLAGASRPLERVEQRVELAAPADERRPHAARDVHADACPCLHRLPGLDRLRLALRLHRLGLAVVDRFASRAPRRLADEDAVDRCIGLKPRRGVDDVAGHHALTLLGPRAERDERLPGVDADAELELGLLVEDPVTDCERGADGALRVVLVRHRRAEDGHHRVADELLHRAAEALELVAQPGVVGTEQRPHLLRIHLLGARREADEIGEEDGDDLRSSSRVSSSAASGPAAGVAEARSLRGSPDRSGST